MASAAAAAGSLLASTRKSIDALLSDVGGLLADLTSPTDVAEDEENEQARRVIDVELQRFWQSYYELKRRHDENSLSVAVLALTKSGKSTLLNSLMGMEVLPMNNVPETARICRIVHDSAAREPLLRDGTSRSPVRGEAAIRSRLQELNSAARTNRSGSGVMSPQPSGGLAAASPSNARGVGGAESEGPAAAVPLSVPAAAAVLNISAPLVALDGFGAEFGRVVLLDTPGPNEAGEEQLKYQVERLLEGVDCVLYLLDYTKLKTAEEEGLFRRLRAINPQLVARLSSRLFFVINKVDACETSEGLDPDEVRAYVAGLVTRQLGGATAGGVPTPPSSPPAAAAGSRPGSPSADPGSLRGSGSGASAHSGGSGGGSAATAAPFRLHPDQVLLLSARDALLARLVLSGRAGPEAVKRFQRLAFGAFGVGGLGRTAAGPSAEQVRAAAGCLLEGSGILDLEGRVLAFLAAHAGSVKMLATSDDTARLLAQIRNVALACHSCLQRNVSALQQEAETLQAELAEAGAAFEEVRQRTDAVQAEVVAEIKAHLNTLRRRLFTHIVQTLDTDARAPAPGATAGSAAAAGSTAAPGAGPLPLSRWSRVREKFLSMFTSTSSALPPGGVPGGYAGPSLVPEARSRSREELQALLLDLHDDLMGQIHSEVYDFWGVLEACAASRHSELLAALNGHLAALSRRVEGAVSETLGVQLAPADIRLRPPSAEQLHSDVQELIEKGIRESNEKHIRVGTRTTTERVLKQPQGPSLCRWGGYWVDVPRTRTVVETYNATVYTLRPDEIANHFIGLVDGAVSASERALSAYVGSLVERQLTTAKERLKDYGDRYLGAMSAALSASSRGAAYRSSALAAVEGYLARLEQLAQRAELAQREAEAAVPGGAAGLLDEVEVFDDDDGDSNDGAEEGREHDGQGYEGGEGRGEGTQEVRSGEESLRCWDVQEQQQLLPAEEKADDEGQSADAVQQTANMLDREVIAQLVASAPAGDAGESQAGGAGAEAAPIASTAMEPLHVPSATAEEPGSGSGIFSDACSLNAAESGSSRGASAYDLTALAVNAISAANDETAGAPAPAGVGAAGSSRGGATPRSSSWSTEEGMYEMVVGPEGSSEEQGREQDDVLLPPPPAVDELPPTGLEPPAAAASELTSIPAAAGAPDSPAALGGIPRPDEAASNDGSGGRSDDEAATGPAAHSQECLSEAIMEVAAAHAISVGESTQVPDQAALGLAAAGDVPAADVPTIAPAPARLGTSPGVPSGSSSGLHTLSAPFDYSRAFLEAMSSSEMVAAGDGVLTMIPLTADGAGSPRGSQDRHGGGTAGSDTPRSGATEEWQLVGEDGLEDVDKAPGGPGRGK